MISFTLSILVFVLTISYIFFLLCVYLFFAYFNFPIYFSFLNLKIKYLAYVKHFYSTIVYELHLNNLIARETYEEGVNLLSLDMLKQLFLAIKSLISAKKENIITWYYLYFENSLLEFFLNDNPGSLFTARFFKKATFSIFTYNYAFNYYFSWQNFELSIIGYYCFLPQFITFFGNTRQNQLTIRSLIFKNTNFTIRFNKYLNVFFQFFKTTIIAFFGAVIFFFFLINYFYINMFKQIAIWLIIGFLMFWLISGFNFFLKKGAFGKLTSALLRFWKRTNTYFWLVEGFLFLLFFYYYLNSSQEPNYMYDFSSLNQNYLPNLYTIYTSTFLLVIVMYYFYYWMLNLGNFSFQQNITVTLIITVIMVYFYVIESYQFYYVLTLFSENTWVFSHETNLWVLEFEAPRMRVKSQYLILALIAKYWHFIFIFLSWLFFIMKFFEQKRPYYTHTGFNLQNLFILFWLNFLFIVQWFKWIFRRFADSIYYWFFTDSNFLFIKYLWVELLFILNCDVRHFATKNVYNILRLKTIISGVN